MATSLTRRELGTVVAGLWLSASLGGAAELKGGTSMFGLIGQLLAAPGRRDELAEILAAGSAGMPGCLSYVIARDTANEDGLWITEIWADRRSHEASLQLPQVREAIARGRALIAGFGQRIETVPIAGVPAAP